MRKTPAKVAISLPPDLYRAVERARKKQGQSRSAFLQDAVRHWLEQRQKAGQIQQYIEGYRRMPETRREIEEAEVSSRDMFAAEEW